MTEENLPVPGPNIPAQQDPHCLLADATVSIFRASIPIGEELRFLQEMEEFFAIYRSKLIDHLWKGDTNKEAYDRYMYRPGMYCLFGAFDLAVLSLIDDYEFATQTLNPGDPDYPARPSQFGTSDIKNWSRFCHLLWQAGQDDAPCPRRRIWDLLPTDARKAVQLAANSEPEEWCKEVIVRTLNEKVLRDRELYNKSSFPGADTTDFYRDFLATNNPLTREVWRFNRCLIEQSFPDTVVKRRPGMDGVQRPFPHRTITGPCPRWSETEIIGTDLYKRKLFDLAQKTFLREEKENKPDGIALRHNRPMPLIGVTRVEVNNSFLIGGGGNFLRCLVKAIETVFTNEFRKARDERDDEMHLIILEGYSWHELTLLTFGRSFYRLDKFAERVRKLTLLDVGELLHSNVRVDRAGEENDKRAAKETVANYRAEWKALLELGNLYLAPGGKPQTLGGWIDAGIEQENERKTPVLTAERINEIMNNLRNPASPMDLAMKNDCLQFRPFGTHVFFNTTTSLGFTADLLKQSLERFATRNPEPLSGDEAQQAIEEVISEVLGPAVADGESRTRWPGIVEEADEQKMLLLRRWTTKAGHDLTGLNAVHGSRPENKEFLLTSGRTDAIYKCKQSNGSAVAFDRVSSREAVATVLRQLLNIRLWQTDKNRARRPDKRLSERAGGVLSVQTTPGWPSDTEEPDLIPLGHSTGIPVRAKLCWSVDELAQVFKNLKKLRVPRVVMGRVLNALALFNEGIQDNFLFGSFLELRPYTEKIVHLIRDQAKAGRARPDDIAVELNKLVDNFERGWRNRFHGGWRLGEVSDFNLEFKGGIQQLVTPFHAAYRMLSWHHTRDLHTLAVVTGEPSITVSSGAVRLNLYDIFHPEFFCARAGHEASEPLLGTAKDNLAELIEKCFPHENEVDQRLKDSLGPFTHEEMEKHFAAVERLSWAYYRSREKGTPQGGGARRRMVGFLRSWWQGDGPGKKSKDTESEPGGKRKGARDTLGKPDNDIWMDALLELEAVLTYDPKFFDQLYADLCNFRTVFLGDRDLYGYWWLASFAVDPINWKLPEIVDEDCVRDSLYRIAFAFAVCIETIAGRSEQLRSKEHTSALTTIKKYWCELADEVEIERRYNFAKDVIRLALTHSSSPERLAKPGKRYEHEELALLGDWFKSAAFLAKHGLATKLLRKELAQTAPLSENQRLKDSKTLVDFYVREDDVHTLAKRRDEALAFLGKGQAYVGGQMRPSLREIGEKGKTKEYLYEADRWFDFCDIVALMHALLKLLKEESSVGGNAKRILVRDKETGAVVLKPEDKRPYAKLVFDPRGGVFTFDPEFRRRYFMLRSAFVMSLLDIAEKSKLTYCEQFQRQAGA